MYSKILKIIHLIVLTLTFNSLFATHIAGGNISYTCTGNPNEYLITLTLFRDCGGVNAPPGTTIDFSNTCGFANPNLNLVLDNVLTAEISQLCPGVVGQSECNGGAFPGYEQYVYTGLVTLPGACDSWTLSYDICNRNAATNLTGGTGNCFYVETEIFSATNACNNSPTITTNYPVPYFCNNQPVTHNFGIAEADGNTLQFSFINALDLNGTNIVYNAGFTPTSPITGISIDPNTGEITFTPTMVGNFVITILIEEFDANGNLVGTMIHDTQFVIENCSNQGVQPPPPGGTNFQNFGTNATLTNGNVISMCDGDQFCVDVVFSDPDVNDILYLGTNAMTLLPGATFTQTGTNPATGTLCWTYQSGYTGNLISITATDSACPTISFTTFTLQLDIPPPLNVSLNDTICGDQTAQFQAIGTPPLTWSVIYGDPMVIGTNFSCNNCTNPVATPTITTAYQIVDGSVCQLTDTIVVAVVQNHGTIDANIITNDTTVCSGVCFDIDAQATQIFSGTSQVSFQTSTTVNIQDNTNNISFLAINGLNMTNLNIGSIESVCLDITHTWDSDLDIYLVCPDGTQFELSTDNGGSSNNYTNTCFTISATQSITSGSAPFTGNFSPEGGVLSGALVGCTANGLWSLQVYDDAGGDQGTINNWIITFNDEIPNTGNASSILWSNTAGLTDPTSPTSQLCPNADGQYILYAYDVDNCWDSDTLNITVTTPQSAGTDSTINVCKESPQLDLSTFIGGTPNTGGVWINSNLDTITQFILPDTIVSGSVFGYLVGTPPCSDTAFITVNVFEVTATTVIDDSDCNACNGSITITTLTHYGNITDVTYTLDAGVPQSLNVFNNLCGGLPGTNYNVLITDSLGCQLNLTETVVDDNFPDLQSITNTDSECGLDDGEVTSAVTVGGTPPYVYLVDGITTPFQNLPIQNLAPSTPNTFDLIVEDAFGCLDTLSFTVNQINPPIITGTPVVNNICNGGSTGEIQVQGTNLNFYSIDGGTTIQTTNSFTGLTAGTYTVTAYSSDPLTTNACSDVATNITVTEPNALDVYNLTPDVTICPNDNITISADQQGGMGNAILTWTVNGSNFGTGNSISLTPNISTQVCVTISESNCPTDTECMNITMPTPIIPSFIADTTNGCYPVNVIFTNTSSNSTDIQSVYWDFGTAGTASGNTSAQASFTEPGVYDVSIQITSIYGCVYDTTYSNLIEVYDYPEANFTITPIPATIYETQVNFIDLSSDDVISWSWDMGTGSSPQFSSEQNTQTEYPEGVPGIYPVTLIVSNANQCYDTIISQVEVINDVIIYVPNVFTPDNDEFNQTWRVYISGIDIYEFHLILFNRWGEIVWESYNPDASWDGTYGNDGDVQDGTYVWVINAKDSYTDKKYEFRGTVTVLR